MRSDSSQLNVVVEMVVCVSLVSQVAKFVNASMDLRDYFVNHPFVSFDNDTCEG